MKNDKNRREQAAELRRLAEETYLKRAPLVPVDPAVLTPEELRRTLHELHVHQIELELQNEELRRVQIGLDTLRARYFDLYDLAPVGYLTISAAGLIQDANLTAGALLGTVRASLVGQSFCGFILQDDQEAYYRHRKLLLADAGQQAFELRLLKKTGGAFWARLEAALGKDTAGADEMHLVISDITACKQAELEKEKFMEALEEKEREMTKFLYAATHDLRTPLVNIQGYSGLLGKYIKELQETIARAALPEELSTKAAALMGESVPEALGYLTGSVLKMNQLITALLKVARVGRLEMSPKAVDMNALLRSVLSTFSFELERTGGAVKLEPLPPCTADAGALSMVFTNLIGNAIKYRNGETKPVITVCGKMKDAATALYTVSDNGSGIKTADLEKIWTLFSGIQQHNPGIKKGEGIGLTVAKRIVSLNSGRIWAESKEGEGAKFFIELPA